MNGYCLHARYTAQTGWPEQTGQPAAHVGPNTWEMRLYSATDERLYLNAEASARRMYGHVPHYTGCRPTEALQLTVGRVLIAEAGLQRSARTGRSY